VKTLTRALLTVVTLSCLWFVLWPAGLGGQSGYVATHGISMEPRFHTGDLAIVRPANAYRVGDVVAYHNHMLKTVVLHRIVGVGPGVYTFKGDNNNFLDQEHPRRDQLIGKLAVRVPQGGIWLRRLTGPVALAPMTFLLLAGSTTVAQTRRNRRKRDAVPRHAAPRSRPRTSIGSLTSPLRNAALSTAALAILGLGLAAVAWTSPLTTTANVMTASSQSVTFDYRARVPRTAAYDDTVIHAPDPIFRKLTNTVDIDYTYRGRPGIVSASALLTAPSGWHSTVRLSGKAEAAAGAMHGAEGLDLNALELRLPRLVCPRRSWP
jgi:signal peptidase I